MIKCDYCGRENQDETAPCPGCGTPPPAITLDGKQDEPGRPVSGSGLLDCVTGLAAIATGHLPGVIHLVHGLSTINSPAEENSPHCLLNRAAALESEDIGRAIALYKQIAQNYPGTPAAEEACRNVQALTSKDRSPLPNV